MTDHLAYCERWHESLSLLAAGCLPAKEEADVRRHLANCAACTARLAELTAVCTSLSRSRPSAALHTAAICEHWNQASPGVPARRPVWYTRSHVFWPSGALVVSLLIVAAWLVQHQPGGPSPGSQEPRVASGGALPGGAPSGTEQAPPPPGLPPPVEKAPAERVWSQPTLRAYERALAQSDEAFEALLQRHGESIVFEPYDPQSLWQESYP